MSLIVNADDFGKSAEINRAITECFEKGYINRTTVMVNMPFAEEAFEIATENGFADKVGIHLNLTDGKPLTDGIKFNPDFCDISGNFNAAFFHSKKKRLHMSKESVEDIAAEFKAQLDRYRELGFTLDHVDSHHHVHTNFPMYKALKMLSDEYYFTSIRLSRNLYKGGSIVNRLYKSFYNKKIKKICEKTSDYFGLFSDALDYFGTNTTDTKAEFNSFCNKYDLEIMVHPMYKDGVLVDEMSTDSYVPFEKEILLYEI